LNGIAESELSVLSTQCLDERISDKQILADEIAAWRVSRRNKAHVKANWRFSTKEARVKLHRLCPAVWLTRTRILLDALQLFVGTLLLLFGMRCLRKAILRGTGIIPLRDEAATYARREQALRQAGGAAQSWDGVALATAIKINMIQGIEVVFIVIALGAAGRGLLAPASASALTASLVVLLLGFVLHRPAASMPENTRRNSS
jgi:uncharacterized small protein (DUF1192 family)